MLSCPRPCTAVCSIVRDVFPRHPIVADIKMLKGWIFQIKIRGKFVLIFNDKSLL